VFPLHVVPDFIFRPSDGREVELIGSERQLALGLRVEIGEYADHESEAQLTFRTNQFNFTTGPTVGK